MSNFTYTQDKNATLITNAESQICVRVDRIPETNQWEIAHGSTDETVKNTPGYKELETRVATVNLRKDKSLDSQFVRIV